MMQLNRRQLIRGFAGLAALAVAPGTASALTMSDQESLVAQMRDNGIIKGQTFRLNQPVTIENVSNLIIADCKFYVGKGAGPIFKFRRSSRNVTMQNCEFECDPLFTGTAFVVEG